ncbi:MAG TPA: hypothetical protein VK826_09955 [Bacteroidia bacterium]|nr:hypothetical protein [Bacteroidia bacterium]
MNKTIALLLIPFSIVFFAFSGGENSGTIGVYDADSVHTAMPRYHRALIECAKRDSAHQVALDTLHARRKYRARELEENEKTDSPLVHAYRTAQLADVDSTIVHLIKAVKEDSISYRHELMYPVYKITKDAAEHLRKEKQYVAVLQKNELDSFRTANPGKYEIVNVTGELITRTK